MASYTQKMIDGVLVPLSPQEIAALQAQEAAWLAKEDVRQAEIDRFTGLKTDTATVDLAERLANATAAQIDAWFASNVNNAAQAIAVLKAVCKILALKLTLRGIDR